MKTDQEYIQWLSELKKRFRQSQIKAAVRVNSELIQFYWNLGRDIVERQFNSNWGDGLIAQLSKDLKAEFPDVGGFSRSNIFACKQFYLFYNQNDEIVHQLGGQLKTSDFKENQQIVNRENTHTQDKNGNQVGSRIFSLLIQVPWRHHVEIITKCKQLDEALFYVQKTIQNGWSRSVLVHFMELDLYKTEGKALSNFDLTLPQPQSELAQQTLKDPYKFEFLSLSQEYNEKDLEDALTNKIIHFLLEMGTGFAFVGRQYPIVVNGDEYRMDLLFYHLTLRCYVVVDLKVVKFEPEFAGKMGFYIAAVNEQLKQPMDNPTIGLIICKTKNDVVVRYALKNINQPVGVAEYTLAKQLPDTLKNRLPTIQEVENEVNNSVNNKNE